MTLLTPMTPIAVTPIRAGDRDRARTASQLGQALAQGYLDMAEYERRVQTAFAAQSTTELRQLLADLPVAQLRRNDPRRREARKAAARMAVRIHLAAYLLILLMVVVVLTVWLAVALSAGAWYFWPVWPILGAGIGVLGHAIPVRLACP
jgi:uncharacterized protein DUF1707/2TM domain-containing protein